MSNEETFLKTFGNLKNQHFRILKSELIILGGLIITKLKVYFAVQLKKCNEIILLRKFESLFYIKHFSLRNVLSKIKIIFITETQQLFKI